MSPLAHALLSFSMGAATASAALLTWLRTRRSGGCRRVAPPHPHWQPGEPQLPPHDADAMIELDPATLDKPSVYAFMISAVVPRPIAFVSTQDAAGVGNLAPYSYFNCMGHNPPLLAFGAARSPSRGGGKKDTLQNIEETGEFVVNIISDWFIEAANHTCGEFARGQDEMKLSGLSPVPSVLVKPPRVREAALQMECKLRHVYEAHDRNGTPSSTIVIGEVVMIHVAQAVTGASPSGKVVVDPAKLQPIARLGGVTYGRVTEIFDLPRPQVQQ